MNTRIFNNIKYLQLVNENHLKNQSLEDNVYFTLRDIFNNISGLDFCIEANRFNKILTNGISYEERTKDFTYTNSLNNKTYICELSKWLLSIDKTDFEFEAMNENDADEKEWYFDTKNLFKFDDWWLQFEELQTLIRKRQ